MSLSNFSLKDLKDLNVLDLPYQLMLEHLTYETDEQFKDVVNNAIENILERMARNPQDRQGRNENGITIEVVGQLEAMGFRASFDTSTGGHCDITVDGRLGHRWLGEAKVFKGAYTWLWEGFLQLDSRYMAGTPKCNSGGILVYTYEKGIHDIMQKWKERLERNHDSIVVIPCSKNRNAFNSIHANQNTAEQIQLRHFPLNLNHEPEK